MSGDTFDIVQGNRDTITGTLHDPAATTGDVLTVQADKSIAAQPGGGSMPIQASYYGNPVTIADENNANVTWDTLADGTDLLDRSVPDAPTFLADGFYSLIITVAATTPLTPAGYAGVFVPGPVTNAYTPTQNPEFGVTVPLLCRFSAGDGLPVNVTNDDGAAPRDYLLYSAVIVKLA